MRLKADWTEHLRAVRQRELRQVFGRCPEEHFHWGLELGAGDGYQSSILSRYVKRLVCTDYNQHRLQKHASGRTSYLICDAESVSNLFRKETFDLVFSSSLLEHLPNPAAALEGIYRVLRQDGITVHVLPSVFWKLCHIVLFNPNRLVMRLDRLLARGVPAPVHYRIGNNPKLPAQARRRRWLLPPPHGAYRNTIQELLAFRKRRWRRLLERSGFHVVRIAKGPVASGYGFGWDRVRALLERCGVASEYIYIAVKAGASSPHVPFVSTARSPESEEA